eukprot:scaffold11714_cov153-Cylindrotheca_fusiformis.AAC.4
MKLSLLLLALLPATSSAHFSGSDDFSGDTIEVNLVVAKSKHSDYQFRIITKPRSGYDPSTDKVEVYQQYGLCVDGDEIMDGDETPKLSSDCCMGIEEFHIWPEKQKVEVGNDFKLDFKYGGGGECSKIQNPQNPVTVGPGIYNSYMVQVKNKWYIKAYDRVIRFPGQDIVGVAYTNYGDWNIDGVLDASDKFFAYWENDDVSVYSSVANESKRSSDMGWGSSFEINCE